MNSEKEKALIEGWAAILLKQYEQTYDFDGKPMTIEIARRMAKDLLDGILHGDTAH